MRKIIYYDEEEEDYQKKTPILNKHQESPQYRVKPSLPKESAVLEKEFVRLSIADTHEAKDERIRTEEMLKQSFEYCLQKY